MKNTKQNQTKVEKMLNGVGLTATQEQLIYALDMFESIEEAADFLTADLMGCVEEAPAQEEAPVTAPVVPAAINSLLMDAIADTLNVLDLDAADFAALDAQADELTAKKQQTTRAVNFTHIVNDIGLYRTILFSPTIQTLQKRGISPSQYAAVILQVINEHAARFGFIATGKPALTQKGYTYHTKEDPAGTKGDAAEKRILQAYIIALPVIGQDAVSAYYTALDTAPDGPFHRNEVHAASIEGHDANTITAATLLPFSRNTKPGKSGDKAENCGMHDVQNIAAEVFTQATGNKITRDAFRTQATPELVAVRQLPVPMQLEIKNFVPSYENVAAAIQAMTPVE